MDRRDSRRKQLQCRILEQPPIPFGGSSTTSASDDYFGHAYVGVAQGFRCPRSARQLSGQACLLVTFLDKSGCGFTCEMYDNG